MIEQIITFEAMEQIVALFGSFDKNIKLVEDKFDVSIISRGSELKIAGESENVSYASKTINALLELINKGENLNDQNVRYVISLVQEGKENNVSSLSSDSICVSAKGKPVKPKTIGQKNMSFQDALQQAQVKHI